MTITLQDTKELNYAGARYGTAHLTAYKSVDALGHAGFTLLQYTPIDNPELLDIAASGNRNDVVNALYDAIDISSEDTQRSHACHALADAYVERSQFTKQLRDVVGDRPELIGRILEASSEAYLGVKPIKLDKLKGEDLAIATSLNTLNVLTNDVDKDHTTTTSLIAAYNAANKDRALNITTEGITNLADRENETSETFATILSEMKQDIKALKGVNFDAITQDGVVTLSELNKVVTAALEQTRKDNQR